MFDYGYPNPDEDLPVRVQSVHGMTEKYFVIKRFKTIKEAEAWVALYRQERPNQYYIDHEDEEG